jgi:hypothetical protein
MCEWSVLLWGWRMLSLGGVGGGDWCGGDDVGENSAEGFHDMRSRVGEFVHVNF